MTLAEMLRSGHNRALADRIAAWISRSAPRFAELVGFMDGKEPLLRQRAPWVVTVCLDRHPDLAKPHLKTFIALLPRTDLHPAVRRNVFRLLQTADLPLSCHDSLFASALGAIGLEGEPVAVKVYAMTVLHRLTEFYPELRSEVLTVIREQLPRETAAFRSRARTQFGITARNEEGSRLD